jgi:hypothetical protein
MPARTHRSSAMTTLIVGYFWTAVIFFGFILLVYAADAVNKIFFRTKYDITPDKDLFT